ncbi:response regulator transcription factor [Microvirga sp. VF16]|uniref:LuxR C-terminal-related transcriptional regulator n=1 Tax=Microvirga sp. VF16 TaxID=2807101 RepID=UPI00193D39B3|nr:response regulator transcription factor [Microvirga sp. VF16]QRM28307.1 response regulator transcription factor [Microvirga sp. VF16]
MPTSLTPTIPTALICDNSLLRSGLQQILSGTRFVVAETAPVAGPRRLREFVSQPALVIIEASQNPRRVLEIVRQVRERIPEVRIVVLAAQFDLSFVRLGHETGVDGFCLAATSPEVLTKSLELIMLGETVVPSMVLRSIATGAAPYRNELLRNNTAESHWSDLKACKLSARERQILSCLREGAPNKLIARKLDVTEATVKVHVKAILRKIGAANRTQAAMWASQRLPRTGVSTLDV